MKELFAAAVLVPLGFSTLFGLALALGVLLGGEGFTTGRYAPHLSDARLAALLTVTMAGVATAALAAGLLYIVWRQGQ